MSLKDTGEIIVSPVVIGVAGGSGSGKSTICRALVKALQIDASVICCDWYYKCLKHFDRDQLGSVNFDHPSAIDFDLLIKHIHELKNNRHIEAPQYDFESHSRSEKKLLLSPNSVIFIEGVLLFSEKRLRQLLDFKVYIDLDSDLRFIRRLRRDTKERGRSADNIIRQYLDTVKVMHDTFVEPTKLFADVVVENKGHSDPVEKISSKIKKILK